MDNNKNKIFIKHRFFIYLMTGLLSIVVTGCSQGNNNNNVVVSTDGVSAPLPVGVAAMAADETSLVVDVVVDGGEPRLCNNLKVDLAAGAFSCDVALSAGQHTLSLLHSVLDATYGKVQLAMVSGIKVDIISGQSTPVDFRTALLDYTDDDGDSISNIKELELGSNPRKVNFPPTFTSTAAFNVGENNYQVATIQASDVAERAIRYSIAGGDDQSYFSINMETGILFFVNAPDFENPIDTDSNNIYNVLVSASNQIISAEQSVVVVVTNVDEAPAFTSPADFEIEENLEDVATLAALDPENSRIIYSLSGGPDGALFSIDSATGQLVFTSAPNFENPMDSDTNNVYQLEVSASDSVVDARISIAVTVTDKGVTEAPLLQVSADTKQLHFSWNAVSEVTHYRLLVNPDGASGFTPISPELSTQQYTEDIVVHGMDWFNSSYAIDACDTNGCKSSIPAPVSSAMLDAIVYIKASNTEAEDRFGTSTALSNDGNTLVIGANWEASAVTGINHPIGQSDNGASQSGAVYVFQRGNGSWQQQAYIKASNTGSNDRFGRYVSLSGDGNTLAVGARFEDSAVTGINHPTGQSDNSADMSGAVYIFQRSNGSWQQNAYIKASNTEAGDLFGRTVVLSDDGSTLAVGAIDEDSNAIGINHPTGQSNNSASQSGAVYVFTSTNGNWQQQAYIKASNAGENDGFGISIGLSSDGDTMVVGADFEASKFTGINNLAGESDNSTPNSGAVYVFQRSIEGWQQQAYVKASNTEANDGFGWSVTLSSDGNTLAVGADSEDSSATGINHPTGQSDNSVSVSGAVYVFQRSNGNWQQQAYVKASNTGTNHRFGRSVALSGDGNTLAVGADTEGSNAMGINHPTGQSDNSAVDAGAVYVFQRNNAAWQQQAYVKAPNSGAGELFGRTVVLNGDGSTLAVGAIFENSNAMGINHLTGQSDNSASRSGAVYLY